MYISPFSCAPIDIEIQGTRANCRSRDTIPTLRQHPKQENVDEDGAGEEHRDAETPFRGKSRAIKLETCASSSLILASFATSTARDLWLNLDRRTDATRFSNASKWRFTKSSRSDDFVMMSPSLSKEIEAVISFFEPLL